MGFDAPGTETPAVLPAGFVLASTTSGRPMLAQGGPPAAVVILLDLTARGASVLALALVFSAFA